MNFKIALISIVILGGALRLINLSTNPPALYWDEASIGYNAFSILKSGIDEHGNRYPLTNFLAYGDAKAPLYIYAVSLFMKFFGVNELAVRLPSAIAGIITVLLTNFFIKELLLLSKKPLLSLNQGKYLPILTSLLLAISPWHLQMSRAGFEANLGLSIFLAGFLFFIKGIHKPRFLLLSSILFSLCFYTFNSYRVFLPIFLLLIGVLSFKKLTKTSSLKWLVISIVTAIVILLPLIPFVTSSQAQLRLNEVSIFKNHEPVWIANDYQKIMGSNFFSKVIFNRRLFFAFEFLSHYFDHFKAEFLFFSGDVNPRLGVRDLGQMYLIELPLLLIGCLLFIKKRPHYWKYLFVWGILSVISAAIARETPHALRILQLLPLPYFFIAIAILTLSKNIKTKIIFFALYLLFFGQYLEIYYGHYQKTWDESWQYGYKELVSYVSSIKNQYQHIYITDSLGRPHTYFLFYEQTDPREYLKTRQVGSDPFGFTYTYSYGQYTFGAPPENPPLNSLVVAKYSPESSITPIKTINNLNNKPVFIVYKP